MGSDAVLLGNYVRKAEDLEEKTTEEVTSETYPVKILSAGDLIIIFDIWIFFLW